jgi:hypothetical protein
MGPAPAFFHQALFQHCEKEVYLVDVQTPRDLRPFFPFR